MNGVYTRRDFNSLSKLFSTERLELDLIPSVLMFSGFLLFVITCQSLGLRREILDYIPAKSRFCDHHLHRMSSNGIPLLYLGLSLWIGTTFLMISCANFGLVGNGRLYMLGPIAKGAVRYDHYRDDEAQPRTSFITESPSLTISPDETTIEFSHFPRIIQTTRSLRRRDAPVEQAPIRTFSRQRVTSHESWVAHLNQIYPFHTTSIHPITIF
jgi:hypothetical protein